MKIYACHQINSGTLLIIQSGLWQKVQSVWKWTYEWLIQVTELRHGKEGLQKEDTAYTAPKVITLKKTWVSGKADNLRATKKLEENYYISPQKLSWK